MAGVYCYNYKTMWEYFKQLYTRYFAGAEAGPAIIIFIGFGIFIYYLGQYLVPFFAAIFLAFLLNEAVQFLCGKAKIPRIWAVIATFIGFVAGTSLLMFSAIPEVFKRIVSFVQTLPSTIEEGGRWLYLLSDSYPSIFPRAYIDNSIADIKARSVEYGESFITYSLNSIADIAGFFVYVLLTLVLLFFILKDYDKLLKYVISFLPTGNKLMSQLGTQMKKEMLRYIAGKLLEGLIIFLISWVVFSLFGLNFALVLALAVGVSVIIPYVGAFVVTVPVVLVAYSQFEFSNMFLYIFAAYLVIQIFDGYLLVPLLFSEIINLHPVSVVLAIMLFGGLWGIWGVAFAIPLATLVKALVELWPKQSHSA